MAATTRPAATEADLLRTPNDGRKYELVDGEIRVSPAGGRHGEVCVNLLFRLYSVVKARGLGHVFESSTGFRLPSGNISPSRLQCDAEGDPGIATRPRGTIPRGLCV